MTTKQAVIFALMVVFLAIALVTLGLWFHLSVSVSVKRATWNAIDKQAGDLRYQQEKLRPVLDDLTNKVKTQQERNQERMRLAFTDPTAAVYRVYEDTTREIESSWGRQPAEGQFEEGAAGKAWSEVYKNWKAENEQIRAGLKRYREQEKASTTQLEQGDQELKVQLDEEEKQRRELVNKRKKWEEDLGKDRLEAEDIQDKIGKATRELEKTPEAEKDGEVLYADPDMGRATVDLGYEHGVRAGLVFTVFSGRHNVPVKKGRVGLTEIRATSSDAVILPPEGPVTYDPSTGWVAPDPTMRYSVYSASGPDETVPQTLERLKSKREIIQELREERARQERAGEEAPPTEELSPFAPLALGKGFEPMVSGDWISNPAFVRLVPEAKYQKQMVAELSSLEDVSLGPLTFCFADNIRPFRREFLRRLCERNHCRAVRQMSPQVDYLVTTPDCTRLDVMEDRLKDIPEEKRANEAELAPEVAERVRVLKALREARKYGARAIGEEQLEVLFVQRQRKADLLKGGAIQPGQHTFFVVGETRLRSVRETGLYIQEHGGVLAPRLDANVDYVVVGGGLTDAKWDKAANRIYYAGQEAPPTAMPFYDAVKTMGLKVLREEELPAFFGRQ